MERLRCNITSVDRTTFAVARRSRTWYSFLQAREQKILSTRPLKGVLQSLQLRDGIS